MFSRILPYWKLVAAMALLWLGWHAHAVVTEARHAKELREQIEARIVAEQYAAKASQQAEQALESLRAKNRTLAKGAAREVTKPDYRTRLPDAGRVLYNSACCGGADPGEPDAALPETHATR